MKTLLTVSLLLLAGTIARAASAYEALRTVGKERGDAVLDRVIELRGANGAPEAVTWKVIVGDKEARGGVREFDVRGAKIVGERTPANGATGKSLNLNLLNLDSDGAHTVAEKESKKTAFAYDHVDYTLRAGAGSGTPMWELRLVDESGGGVAEVSIAADTGKLIAASGLKGGRSGRLPDSDPQGSAARPPEPREREDEKRGEGDKPEVDKPGTKVSRFLDRASNRLGGAFQRFGDRLNRTFTNEPRKPSPRSAPKPAPASPDSYRDKNGTEFYRPRD